MPPHLINNEWGYEWGHHLIDSKLIICSILLLLIIYKLTRSKTGVTKNPPLCPYSSISVVREHASGTLPWLLLRSAREVGSTFKLHIFTKSILVINDVDLSRKILCDSSQEKHDGYKQIKAIHGQQDDILTSVGSSWHQARKGMSSAFSSRHIGRMNKVVVKQTENFISNKLDQMVEEELGFDVGEEMIWLTLGIICETAFEYDINHEEKCMLRNEITLVLKEAAMDRMIPLRWIFGYLNPATKRARVGTQKMLALALKIIDSYNKLESPIKGTVIDCIMKNQAYKDDNARSADILILLFAGHDTTAYSVAWILIELAKNPIDQAVLHNNLRSVTYDKRKDVKMLEYVIKEGLRLHPVAAAGFGRKAQKDIIFKQKGSNLDFTIPKGAPVLMPNLSRHRDADYYEDPDVFRPLRWENPCEKAVSAFMPFGLGKRNCIGQSLANAELYSILALLLSEYHFAMEEEGVSNYKITMEPKGYILKVARSVLVD